MVLSSFLPIRRLISSSFPFFVSKDHFPLFFTIGIGKGQSSAPNCRTTRVSPSGIRAFFVSYALMNCSFAALSCTASPEDRISFPPGPKMLFKALVLSVFNASTKALTACSGDTKVFCAACRCVTRYGYGQDHYRYREEADR